MRVVIIENMECKCEFCSSRDQRLVVKRVGAEHFYYACKFEQMCWAVPVLYIASLREGGFSKNTAMHP